MAKKGILPPIFKMVLKKYYSLSVRQPPVLRLHPEILSCSSPLPCTEPELLGDNQTKSESLGAPADELKEEQLEISLVEQYEEIQLDRAQVSEEEGKVVPKRECPALKLPLACKGLERPE